MAKLTEKEAKELWVRFAAAALNGYSAQEQFDDDDELADDMATVASKCADAMLDEYEDRFCETPKRGRKKRELSESEEDPELEEEGD